MINKVGMVADLTRAYHVYILTNHSGSLYTGVTNNLWRRVWEHRQGKGSGFTRQYHIHRLIYYEAFGDIRAAIAREKQIKGWLRVKKIALINGMNPAWKDLSGGWYADDVAPSQDDPSP